MKAAEVEISAAVWERVTRHDLTYGEALRIILGIADDFARYLVRSERHGDDEDKKGDEE